VVHYESQPTITIGNIFYGFCMMQTKSAADIFVESSQTPIIFVKSESGGVLANMHAKEILQKFHISDDMEEISKFLGESNQGLTFELLVQKVKFENVEVRDSFHVAFGDQRKSFNLLAYPFASEDHPGVCVQILQDSHSTEKPDLIENQILIQERAAEYSDLNSFLTAILDSSTETFIIAVGLNGSILSFNNGACLMFQYAKRDVIGRVHVSELFADMERDAGVWDEMAKTAFDKGKSEKTTNLLRRDRTVFPALVDLTPLKNAEDQTLGILFLGRDMTESLKTQHALADRKDELEFINKVSLGMGESLKVEEVASVALQQLHAMFSGIYSTMYLLDKEEMRYNLISSIPGFVSDDYEEFMYPTIDDSLLMDNGELLIRGVGKLSDPATPNSSKPTVKMMIPLLQKASLIGVVSILTPKLIHRDEELIRFGSALGATIGSALENSILFDDSVTKSQEIKKQNQELDEFAYVVSHDLKEPLAGISFISNLLVDEYYNTFDATGKTYIASLIDFSKRLGSLIDALLDLSRIGRITSPPEHVELSEVFYNVQQNLLHRLNQEDIEISVPKKFPPVLGDKTRIEQVFFNLIGNAIKFNDKEHPAIEIGYTEHNLDFWQFFVKDNGIGIESEYYEKIFKIFERLQAREEYEGNGAGLTIVKKIIENHGGHIWLESVLDEGTTFYFTLPKFTETS
jgi:PAS domain S-box-containing protein